jgi:cyclase
MFRPRVIPVLLLKNLALVKSKKFTDHNYIGDAINAVRIFNDLKADELVFLDIEATAQNRTISLDFIKDVGEEANMPFSVGGGIRTIEDIRKIIKTGAERVIIGSYAVIDPDFIFKASQEFGSSTITVCIDVKKKLLGGYQVCYQNGKKGAGTLEHLKQGNNPGGATGLAAGSLFVYHGPKKGVLINYPDRSELSFKS